MQLTIVVPCYNESRRLDLRAFERFLDYSDDSRLLFVDDGSTDNTAELLAEFCQDHARYADLLILPSNGGKAEAVRQGILFAAATSTDCIGFWDADLATRLGAAEEFRDVLQRRPLVQIVWGSRLTLLGREIDRQPLRRFIGRVFSASSAIAVGLPIRDALCGAKLFRNGPLVADLFSRPFDSRWIFDVEILARLRALAAVDSQLSVNSTMFELPLDEWREVGDSRLRPRDFIRAGVELLRLFWQTRIRRDRWTALPVSENAAESTSGPLRKVA
jgi:glycosyltransferase involved in cell wall biosynthesis